ncbi:hypothetical protein TNCT_399871 [Trichonephila clavata]|uniref:Uncharacterized protein n=1 Tax=Trichonephila clavata TaxID=2740835 RepID=A0A8X6FSS3_TRICU|nr:hypothetical protein TNCT_399871 [Trichonephila clavata]
MMKKLEATGSLASRQKSERPSTTAAVPTTVGQTVQFMSCGCCTWILQCSRSFEADRTVVWKYLKSTANNFATISLQVAT